jgi:hypothetical protein
MLDSILEYLISGYIDFCGGIMRKLGIRECVDYLFVWFIVFSTWKPFIAFNDKVIDMWSEGWWGAIFYLCCLFGTIYATYLIVIMWADHDLVIRKGIK